jgi:hypothetical protein
MAIKVTLGATENTQQEKPFPKLMKGSDELIVFFYVYEKGTVIQDPLEPDFVVGEYDDNWDMSAFTDYNEPITIQNL